MSAPHLLLVDDSHAILAFEEAVLGAHYTISKAAGGGEALQLMRDLRPAIVLLDLSMPEMDGEEVLARMKSDASLRDIPVIVVSTEHHRADACLKAGAVDFIPKPIRADSLRAVVERVLAQTERDVEGTSLGVLFVETCNVRAGIPLDTVVTVALQPATIPVVSGCPFLRELFVFRQAPVALLDMADWLGKAHARPLVDRKIVIVEHAPLIALSVDDVSSPEVIPPRRVHRPDGATGSQTGVLAAVTIATVETDRGEVPVIDVQAMVSPELEGSLHALLKAALAEGAAMGGLS
jgi:CheY-like chemotaxis protein/chemotaxis signal transduction protein